MIEIHWALVALLVVIFSGIWYEAGYIDGQRTTLKKIRQFIKEIIDSKVNQ